jgi:ribose-phosphate pyrophosphokinase
VDLHAGQIQGFFDIPVDHLYSIAVLGAYFKKKNIKDLVVVSPDVGGIKMARGYAKLFRCDLAIVDKRRENAGKTHVMHIIGSVAGKNVVLVDDLISTGGSIVEAANALKKNGAKDIYACIVHPVLAGSAVEKIKKSVIKELIVTNSIPLSREKKNSKIRQLSIAPLLADAIWRIHNNVSISALFFNDELGVEA